MWFMPCLACCLQGTLFHDRMSPKVLEMVRSSLVELEEDYLQTHPGAQIQRIV